MKPTQRKKSLTKEEVIAALKQCARKLGRVPTYPELRKMSRATVTGIRKHFGTLSLALRTAELEVGHAGAACPGHVVRIVRLVLTPAGRSRNAQDDRFGRNA
jgi:hypothetical protein